MLSHTEIKDLIEQQGILPLFFNEDAAISIDIVKALYAAGIRIIEYTNRGETALANFKQLKEECAINHKDMYLGIGTIKTADAANAFINAGADFLISPAWNNEILAVCNEKNYLWIPGCMTPTEIAHAELKGITMVKIFPGNVLGPTYISAIKEVFPAMKFMPTGGVSLDKNNLAGWFKAGVVAVGMGSKLISKELIANKDYTMIEALAKEALEMVKTIKTEV
ncbi:bifunctional 4-hydroxy-2-oxoglutarate aldolase/2-dehydro-3-deoxy-phosphogluconate aldolase [Parafilimonas sp.]|uniref:bifunctional 4-hydroxy-2-oxoglutarate aldolase/2-dehydro-3-deoxy-phosphogluconate aldolase n=1 Tax=Parafilimonas sp. TaxID=1969739 RepID=UPI003F7DDE12